MAGHWAPNHWYAPSALDPSEDADLTTGYTVCYDHLGEPEENVEIHLQMIEGIGTAGKSRDNVIRTGTSNGDGLVQFPGMRRSARYQVRRGELGEWRKFTADDASTTALPETLGNEG